MESSAPSDSPGPSGWSTVKESAASGDWEECLKLLIPLLPTDGSQVLGFRQIGRETVRTIALSIPDEVHSLHDYVTMAVARADELCRELGVNFPEAKAAFTRIQLAISDGSSSSWVTVASELRDLGRPHRAIQAASKALELARRNVAAFNTRAASFADMFDTDRANADIRAAEKLSPNNRMVMNTLSRVRALEGKPGQSLKVALHSFYQKPTKAGALQVVSRLKDLGLKASTITWYELATRMPEEMPRKLTEAQQRGLGRLVGEALKDMETATGEASVEVGRQEEYTKKHN